MKGGQGETRSHYLFFFLMTIYVAWEFMEWHSREVQFPWLGRSGLRGQDIILGRELLALLFVHP